MAAISEEGVPARERVNKIALILRKEWLELRGERGLLLGTILPPLFLTILPVLLAWAIGVIPHEGSTLAPPPDLGPGIQVGGEGVAAPIVTTESGLENLDTQAVEQAVIGSQFSILFLLMPIVVPAVIASYSIVGEKTGRTLEPVLATSVRVGELLLGKALAAFLPAVALTWIGAGIFVGGMALVALSPRVIEYIVTVPWLLSVLFCAPLMSMIAIALTVAVSSRARDPRTAQQISTVLIFPVVGVIFGRVAGMIAFNSAFVAGASLVLLLVAVCVTSVAIRLFKREVILTRWS